MKERRLGVFVAVFAVLCLLGAAQVSAGAKTPFTGWAENPWLEDPGTVRVANGNVQIRGLAVSWDLVADDERLEGVAVNVLSITSFGDNPTFVARLIAKLVLYTSAACARTFPGLVDCDGPYWEGTMVGKDIEGIQQGRLVLRGRGGDIDGLVVKGIWFEDPFAVPTVIHMEGNIIEP